MEGLPKDIRTYIVRRFLVLGSLRNLLCVSKSYYMMFKFFVRIQTVPFGGSYIPPPCGVCNSKPFSDDPPGWNNQGFSYSEHKANARLPKRSLDHLIAKNGMVECEKGHRFLCHSKDKTNEGMCSKCESVLKKIKV